MQEKIGKIIGFLAGYFMFTLILFFVLGFFGKLPNYFNFYSFMLVTIFITLLGGGIRYLLK